MTVIAIHNPGAAAEHSDILAFDAAELGESILDIVTGHMRHAIPNAAAIVLAFEGLRTVAASHGLDAACLWIGSDPDPMTA